MGPELSLGTKTNVLHTQEAEADELATVLHVETLLKAFFLEEKAPKHLLVRLLILLSRDRGRGFLYKTTSTSKDNIIIISVS